MPTHQEQFQQIEQENRSRIFRICRAYLSDPDDAQDLYQDIMVQVWLSLHKFRGEAKLSTWLYRIALNTAILYQKKQQRLPIRIQDLELQIPDASPDHTADLEKEQLLLTLHQCIAQLEKQERLLVSLVLEEVSYKEMAEVLGISINHVGVKVNRAKKKLAQLMEKARSSEENKGGYTNGF